MKKVYHCIALRTVRHNDRTSILTAYTREAGRMAFAVAAGAGRSAARTRAITMPLSLFECVAQVAAGREVQVAGEFKSNLTTGGQGDIIKGGIVLFLAEVLNVMLREPMADGHLFDVMHKALVNFHDRDTSSAANFHIAFLLMIAKELGIEPDWSTATSQGLFDLYNGVWCRAGDREERFRFASADESQALSATRGMDIDNCSDYRMSRAERNLTLDVILKYFSSQGFKTDNLASLKILREIY